LTFPIMLCPLLLVRGLWFALSTTTEGT